MFLIQSYHPLNILSTSEPENFDIDQCLFTQFKQNVINFDQDQADITILRSCFVCNHLIDNAAYNHSHITIISKRFYIFNTLMRDVKVTPNVIFFQSSSNTSRVFQCSFDTGYNVDGHYAFSTTSQILNLTQTNISRISSTYDTAPRVACKEGIWKFCEFADFTSFRTMFRYSQIPIQMLNILNCSGKYLVERENTVNHFIECVFYDVKLTNEIGFIINNKKEKIIFEDCIFLKCNFEIPTEFTSGKLLTTGQTISFRLVNDCICKSNEAKLRLGLVFCLINCLLK